MALNRYQWNLYLKAGGEKTVHRFQAFLDGKFEDYPDLIKELVSKFCPDKWIIQDAYDSALWAVNEINDFEKNRNDNDIEEDAPNNEPTNAHDLIKETWEYFLQDPVCKSPRSAYTHYIYDLIAFTHVWSFYEPGVFFPYLFRHCFIILSSIADMFGIELPPIPGKTKHLDRMMYYADLCDVSTRFADENGLSSAELYAFLYEYAPSCVGGTEWACNDIPEPRSVFVFGVGKWYPEKEPDVKWICQGSPDMQPGDIGILYHWNPVSCFTSVWRAISPGFYDPLGLHDRYVCYGYPVLIPSITYSELKADPVFKETALVKTNMLRMDGAPMLPSEYMHLLDMARLKGDIPENIPILNLRTEISCGELSLERDVEIQLLEPLLLRLGWKPENWCRQMPVHIGRGISKYPDYVINPVYTKYNERGDIVLEAKLTIPNNKQLEHDRGQANSYAKLLNARAYVLVAREGIWISKKDDGFSGITAFTWAELKDANVFTHVYSIIGNKKQNLQKKR